MRQMQQSWMFLLGRVYAEVVERGDCLVGDTGERQGELAVAVDGSFTIPKSAHTIYFEVVR